MMDKIIISNILAYGYHGLLPEERQIGQTFYIDLEIQLDLKKPGVTDNIKDTLDYIKLHNIVQDCVRKTHYQLLEAIAENIAKDILIFPMVKLVKVKIVKPHVPVPEFFGQVSVEIIRNNASVIVN